MTTLDDYNDWAERRKVQAEAEVEGRARAETWYALDDEGCELAHRFAAEAEDGIRLTFGGNTDADTFYNVFGHMKGYMLEVNDTDVELFEVTQPEGQESIGFVVRDTDEGGAYASDFRFIPWNDVKSVLIY